MSVGIFGYTGRIPDPRYVYNTTYPNRFRGSDWSIPRFGLPFIENPMAKPPFAGLGGCGCAGMQKAGGASTEDFSGYHGVPRAMGAVTEAPVYVSVLIVSAMVIGTAALLYKFASVEDPNA